MEDLKKCPDCAEMVRSEARVCRFCGYRFDGARRVDRTAGALADLVRRPRAAVPLPELLAGWGTELLEGETVDYFGHCRLDRSYGFLLITSGRIVFFAGRRAERTLEWSLAEVRAIEPGRRWGSRVLSVSGPGRTVTLERFESRRTLAEIERRLGATADG